MNGSGLLKRLGYAVVALVLVGFALATMDRARSLSFESLGEVQSVGFVLADSPPRRMASIKLDSGELVSAQVGSAHILQPGTKVRVLASKRVISGAHSYEVLGLISAP